MATKTCSDCGALKKVVVLDKVNNEDWIEYCEHCNIHFTSKSTKDLGCDCNLCRGSNRKELGK